MIPQVCSCANMYLVKGIKLQIGAFCMLGKKEWMEFIVSASRHHTHELNNPLLHNQMKKVHLDVKAESYVRSSSLGLPGVKLGFFSVF